MGGGDTRQAPAQQELLGPESHLGWVHGREVDVRAEVGGRLGAAGAAAGRGLRATDDVTEVRFSSRDVSRPGMCRISRLVMAADVCSSSQRRCISFASATVPEDSD
jgi:hypothetical protein